MSDGIIIWKAGETEDDTLAGQLVEIAHILAEGCFPKFLGCEAEITVVFGVNGSIEPAYFDNWEVIRGPHRVALRYFLACVRSWIESEKRPRPRLQLRQSRPRTRRDSCEWSTPSGSFRWQIWQRCRARKRRRLNWWRLRLYRFISFCLRCREGDGKGCSDGSFADG